MQTHQQQNRQINLDAIFGAEDAKRKRGAENAISRERELLRIMRDEATSLMTNKKLFREFMETFFYIKPKGRGLLQFEINNSQDVLLDCFWLLKDLTPYVRMNILKGRQQGMSTMIGALAVMEMLIYRSTGALIATENMEISGKNIYRMYELYLREFQELMKQHLKGEELLWVGDVTERFNFGKECTLANDSIFAVVGETNVTSRTLQFIHLSEAAFYHHLDDCLGMMLQTLPGEEGTSSSMFIETTAKMYGNEHHDGWEASSNGKSEFKPLFLPWYIHHPYRRSFGSKQEKEEFKETLGQSDDDEYGNEKALLETNNENDPWRKQWPGVDFKKYGYDKVSLENLKFRRFKIKELKFLIHEFNRQYPTTPDMAFMSKSAHVLDMDAVRWYMREMLQPPREVGLMDRAGYTAAQFEAARNGVIAIWEHPLPHHEYIIGVDVAEGFDSGDFSCAYVIDRLPLKIVARLRGTEGRTVRLEELEEQLFRLGHYYHTAHICVENNNAGEAVTSGLQRLGYPRQVPENLFTLQGTDSGRFGWRSARGDGTRTRGVNLLQEVVANKHIGIPCEILLDEAHHFHYINGKAQAARKGQPSGVGRHDDCLLALVGALLAHEKLIRPKTESELREAAVVKKQKKARQEEFRNSRQFTDYKRYI